ncbi:MAG TPA: hypothetical protein PLV51_13300 [Lentimicrobium sp.]|nr:hypothetical protein [Lentimicrobium sp.]
MSTKNYRRMMQLIDRVFAVKNDPDQLDVDEKVMQHLLRLHPATFAGHSDENGPVAWVLVIPTTLALMQRFIRSEINEKQLVDFTPEDEPLEALYLCSATVLEEYRRQGLTRRLALESIEKIRQKHPLKALFVWPFSDEGDAAAEAIAAEAKLPLYKREKRG